MAHSYPQRMQSSSPRASYSKRGRMMTDSNQRQGGPGRLAQWLGRRLAARSQRAALAAFRRAAKRVPAYQKLLNHADVQPRRITTVRDWPHVPITDKQMLFADHPLSQLCVDGRLNDAVSIYTSSGYSGVYSFGAETFADANRVRSRIDRMLQLYFNARSRSVLLINALPAGVHTPSRLATVVETSTRPDALLAIVNHLGDEFEQIVVVAEHPFLKTVLEMGVDQGLDWARHHVHLVTGAEVLAENTRSYFASLLGRDRTDEDAGRVYVSLGISEVSLSLGQETDSTIRIRQAALEDDALREAMFGKQRFLPTFVQYDPRQVYIENDRDERERDRVLITTLDKRRKIPLIRYATNDWARVYPYDELIEILRACGRLDLAPAYPLPCFAMWGRGRGVQLDGRMIYPEQVKEALYADHDVAGALTGDFQIKALAGGRLHASFQLNQRGLPADPLDAKLTEALRRYVPVDVALELIPFEDFHHNVPLSFQQKRHYLASED